jgi:hypothetical protein
MTFQIKACTHEMCDRQKNWYLFLAKSRFTKYERREWIFLFVQCKTQFSIKNMSLLEEFPVINITVGCLVDCWFDNRSLFYYQKSNNHDLTSYFVSLTFALGKFEIFH